MDLKELESGVDPYIHWYYQSKKVPLVEFVKNIYEKKKIPLTIVDVGSGSGFFMQSLLNHIPALIKKVYLVDTGYSDGDLAVSKNQMLEKTRELPEKIENSVVVMMDVLEHLEDDQAMLRAIRERSVNDNYFFITVPAFMSLWSGHDVYLGHYRRYTRSTLRRALHQSGFTIFSSYYFYGFIFPVVWLTRKFQAKSVTPQSDMKPVKPFTNELLKNVCSVERRLRKLNIFGGVTCVAEGKI